MNTTPPDKVITMEAFDSPPPKSAPKAIVDALKAKRQKYLNAADEEFGDRINLPLTVGGLTETLMKLAKEDDSAGRALLHVQAILKALVRAKRDSFAAMDKYKSVKGRQRLQAWQDDKMKLYDDWNIILEILLTHCPLCVLKFRTMKDGQLVIAGILANMEQYVNKSLELSVQAGTMPSEADTARYNEDTELQAIVRGVMFPLDSPITAAPQADVRYLAPSFPDDEVITLFLEAKGMLPLHIDARQGMTFGDLCREFKKQRYITMGMKIEAWCQGVELPEYFNVGSLSLKKGETIEMRVRWEK